MAISLDPDPVIECYKRDIDRTLIRANLQRTPEERLRNLMALQRFAEELRAAGRRVASAVTDYAALLRALAAARSRREPPPRRAWDRTCRCDPPSISTLNACVAD